MSINETSAGTEAAVKGVNTNATPSAGVGLHGISRAAGVVGESETWHGVVGFSRNGGFGIYGKSPGSGVVGESTSWHGVAGISESTNGGFGVYGKSPGAGVVGESKTWHGVGGFTESTTGGFAVYGEHKANGTAMLGKSVGGAGVWGVSDSNEGVHAESRSTTHAALAAFNINENSDTAAIYGKKSGARGYAGYFDGNVAVRGVLDIDQLRVRHADFAEEFAIAAGAYSEPGMVMVLTNGMELAPCEAAYDRRVVGVISGAGTYQPGVLLDRSADAGHLPIALLGKVCCWADAESAPIAVGDLLTTSPIAGHAMKVEDSQRALGAIIGKALAPLASGRGLIPILITLL